MCTRERGGPLLHQRLEHLGAGLQHEDLRPVRARVAAGRRAEAPAPEQLVGVPEDEEVTKTERLRKEAAVENNESNEESDFMELS